VSGSGLVPQTIQTSYDADGHVAEVQQPNGDITGESYDRAGQHVQTFFLLAGGNSTTDNDYYDPAGNVYLTVDADGREHNSTWTATSGRCRAWIPTPPHLR
jgi:YD repeat-containing protein